MVVVEPLWLFFIQASCTGSAADPPKMANLPVPALCQFCPLLRVEWSADHHKVDVQSDQRNVSIEDKDRGADIVISIGNAELPSVATIKVTINVDGSEDGQPNALRESGLHKLQFEVDGDGNPTKGAIEIAKNFGRDR